MTDLTDLTAQDLHQLEHNLPVRLDNIRHLLAGIQQDFERLLVENPERAARVALELHPIACEIQALAKALFEAAARVEAEAHCF